MLLTDQLQLIDLQFITQGDHLKTAKAALEGGCRWIQLRIKDNNLPELESIARKLLDLCNTYKAILIIDDNVDLCNKINAHGVHLGKTDMHPTKARKLLKNNQIIGVTCNSFEDIQAIHQHADYIGLGPFRFTTTKKNLSPIIGLEGYQNIIQKCHENSINTPIVAIGGITLNDIPALFQTGINSIAVSGTIAKAQDPIKATQNIINVINQIKQTK